MADIGRPPPADDGTAAFVTTAFGAGVAVAALGEFEAKRAVDRVGFGEAQLEALAERVAGFGVVADQALARLVIAEIFVAQIARGNEAVAP